MCSCKKNELLQEKNGILLIDIEKIKNNNSNDKSENYIKFFETNDFEVYSFCPLINKENKNTNYFLVGGYDKNHKKGEIQIYKFLEDKNKNEDEIKFVSRLEFKNNNIDDLRGENKAIKCIIQTNDEKILAACSDGNIYLFQEPELELYEKNKKENEEDNWTFLKTLKY